MLSCTCSFSFLDGVGLVGVFITLLAYFLLQIGKMPLRSWYYSFCNAIGSFLILLSLFEKFNLAAFAMEGIWFLVSLYGIFKAFQYAKKHKIN